jgi:ParB family chromosome partitioning protein
MGVTIRAKPRRKTRDAAGGPEYAVIPLDRIEPDSALSRSAIDPDRLRELAESLEQQGQLSPITVRRVAGRDKLLIISGERRWRAALLTRRIRALVCLIFDEMSEADALLRRIAEDLARDDFVLLELGEMIARVRHLRGWSLRRLAREVGVKIDRLRRPLALLRLPTPVQEMVRRGVLKPSHAYQVSRAPAADRQAIAERVVRRELTHEQTVALVRRRRAAVGIQPQAKQRLWRFSAPGGCKVVVKAPRGHAGRWLSRRWSPSWGGSWLRRPQTFDRVRLGPG